MLSVDDSIRPSYTSHEHAIIGFGDISFGRVVVSISYGVPLVVCLFVYLAALHLMLC